MHKDHEIGQSGLMSPEKLSQILEEGEKRLKLLDATYVLPGDALDPKAGFQKRRIGGAQFFDIREFADQTSPLPHMLPKPEEFAAKASALGLSNDDLIVIYAQHGMVMGPARAWWMFRIFG